MRFAEDLQNHLRAHSFRMHNIQATQKTGVSNIEYDVTVLVERTHIENLIKNTVKLAPSGSPAAWLHMFLVSGSSYTHGMRWEHDGIVDELYVESASVDMNVDMWKIDLKIHHLIPRRTPGAAWSAAPTTPAMVTPPNYGTPAWMDLLKDFKRKDDPIPVHTVGRRIKFPRISRPKKWV